MARQNTIHLFLLRHLCWVLEVLVAQQSFPTPGLYDTSPVIITAAAATGGAAAAGATAAVAAAATVAQTSVCLLEG